MCATVTWALRDKWSISLQRHPKCTTAYDRTDHFLFTVKTQKKAKPSPLQNYDLLTSHFTGGEKDNSLKEKKPRWDKVWKKILPCPKWTKGAEIISYHLGLSRATSTTFCDHRNSAQPPRISQEISPVFSITPTTMRFISYIKSTTYCSCCCSSICQIFPNSPCLLHSFLKSSMSKITNSEKKQSLCFSDISPRFSVQYPKLIKVCSHR